VICGNRQQGNVACPFDRLGDVTLMRGTVSGNPAWHNFAPLGDEETERARLFIIDDKVFLRAETANFTPLERTTFAWSTLCTGSACWWPLTLPACGTLADTGRALI
jgi:hypothetical protein